jgi:signal transduction histidine kinase/ligand-binding sensor domain-containing protein
MRRALGRRQNIVGARTLLASMLLAWGSSAYALNPAFDVSQYAHTAWKIRDGFTRGVIRSIAQTRDGYLWLGTEFGLLRFDGVRNVPWQPPSSQVLPSTEIWGLLAARDGTLWIGTQKGLASWKGGKLTRYTQLDGLMVSRLLEDREGSVWAGGSAVPAGRLCAIKNASVRCYGEDGSFGPRVFGLYEDTKSNLWVGVVNGFWRWKPGIPRFYSMPGELDSIQGFVEGEDGAFLITTRNGIRRLVDGKVEAYSVPGSVRECKPKRVLRDREGSVWMGSSDRGLAHVHQGRSDVFTESDGLSGDFVETVFEDREGNIWVATESGLDRFRDLAVPRLSGNQGLSGTLFGGVLADRDGGVWVGTSEGLKEWKQGQVSAYRERAPNRPGAPVAVREIIGSGLPAVNVESLFQDQRGRTWVATLGGVGYLENDRFVSIRGVPGGNVRAIAEDTHANLWISNREFDLLQLPRKGEPKRIPWAALGRKDFATALVADRAQGGLWLGFFDGGVAYYDHGQIRATYAAANGLGEGRVNDFSLDRDGTLWAATEGGLSRFKNGAVSTLNSKNGLPCDAVQWVIEDDDRSLWLSTACGLVRVARAELEAWAAALDTPTAPKRTIQARVFDSSDGVRIRSQVGGYRPQVTKSIDGRLWFVSVDGVRVVDPRHLPFNSLPPPVHIEQITADRKTYDVASDTGGHVPLPALTRDLQIDYTALSLVAPEKMKFRYMLEGWDQDWQDVGTRRKAFYSNLPPRNYRFHVIASNNSGVWNQTGAVLDLSIAPAYYQTAWFRTLAVVMFLSLLWAAHRLRLRVVERHQAEITALNESLMKAQEQERTRIAGELHDGVMQQISALTLMLGTGRRQPEADAKQTMADVQRKLIEVGAEVRQLTHDLHPASLKDRGLPDALRAYCDEFSRVRGISVSCDADDAVRELSRGAALALYRIVQEAMGNAVTHGAAQHVDVRLARSNGLVALTVTDDGKGFDPNRIGGLRGLGLINMRERARQLNGTFELDCGPGRGTTVRVTIPFRPAV